MALRRKPKINSVFTKELQFVELKNKVANKTRTEIDKQQRDYFYSNNLRA